MHENRCGAPRAPESWRIHTKGRKRCANSKFHIRNSQQLKTQLKPQTSDLDQTAPYSLSTVRVTAASPKPDRLDQQRHTQGMILPGKKERHLSSKAVCCLWSTSILRVPRQDWWALCSLSDLVFGVTSSTCPQPLEACPALAREILLHWQVPTSLWDCSQALRNSGFPTGSQVLQS